MQKIKSNSIRGFIEDERCRFRSIKSEGKRVVIRLSERCNLKCPHCLVGSRISTKELSLNDWKKILAELPLINTRKVLLTGGEPLLHNEIIKITEFITQMGIPVDLNSNMQLMTPQMIKDFKYAGLTEISVSIEGPEAIHDLMHGKKGAFTQLVNAIYWAVDENIPVDAACCITSQNIDYIWDLLELIQELPLESFTFARLLPVGHGYKATNDTLSQDTYTRLYEEIKNRWISKSKFPIRLVGLLGFPNKEDCQMGKGIIGIRPNGAIEACVLSVEQNTAKHPFESGLKSSVDELLNKIAHNNCKMCY